MVGFKYIKPFNSLDEFLVTSAEHRLETVLDLPTAYPWENRFTAALDQAKLFLKCLSFSPHPHVVLHLHQLLNQMDAWFYGAGVDMWEELDREVGVDEWEVDEL